jgi:uncharacterized protein
MPVQPTYPGVYVEEIPSPVHTITGVSTSITVFVGRAPRGPLGADADGPVTVTSFGDFTRQFGGLQRDLPLTYAVRDFFQNGGGQAVIVRLFRPPATPAPAAASRRAAGGGASGLATSDASTSGGRGTDGGQAGDGSSPGTSLAVPAVTSLSLPDTAYAMAALPGAGAAGVSLRAASPGGWADQNVQFTIDTEGIAPGFVPSFPGLAADDLFNLTVTDVPANQVERFTNVTLKDAPGTSRRLDLVLQRESTLVRAAPSGAAWPPQGLTRPDPSPLDPNTRRLTPTLLAGGADSDALDQATYATLSQVLDKVDLFNLLCIPPDVPGLDTPQAVFQTALEYCYARRAILIVDPPLTWAPNRSSATWMANLDALGLQTISSRNAAVYFPRVVEADPQREGQPETYVPCGIVAGIIARNDVERGVWKAPAGTNAAVAGIEGLAVPLTDADSGVMNALGINVLRTFPVYGTVVWGARTLRGADLLEDQYKYLPVRRLTLFIEESLYRGLKWAVFEPNDEPLWAQIRLNVGAFMNELFRQGAFQGATPSQAYFAKCDSDTTTQNDIDRGVVNVVVGFAPLKPAEFVIVQIQQMAGQLAV